MKLLKIIPIGVILFLFSSCDCFFDYTFEVENLTQDILKVQFQLESSDLSEIEIEPGEILELGTTFGPRCGCTNCEGTRWETIDGTFGGLILDIQITTLDSIQTSTDFNIEENWVFQPCSRLGVYRAEIRESDF